MRVLILKNILVFDSSEAKSVSELGMGVLGRLATVSKDRSSSLSLIASAIELNFLLSPSVKPVEGYESCVFWEAIDMASSFLSRPSLLHLI